MTEIVVIVPVLARPHRAQPLVASLAASTLAGVARLLFVASPGDEEQQAACTATGADLVVADWEPGHADFARKIQTGFDASDEPFVFQAADDVTFEPGWAEAALAEIDRAGAGVCGTWDGANPLVMRGLHSTHSLIRRSYVDECGASWDGPGTVFSTAYAHQWVDSELVELAKVRGCFTFAADAHVIHHHPMFDRSAVMDATYEKSLSGSLQDAHTFQSRQAAWTRAMVAA